MKPKHLLLTIVIFTLTLASFAQNPITTLQHAGTTQVFYGQNSFVEAYNAATTGDTLNLSVGAFTPPSSFGKGLVIIGAGYYPDDISNKVRTTILGGLWILECANLYIEGLFINGNVGMCLFVNNIKIVRCYFNECSTNGCARAGSYYNISLDECVIGGNISFPSNTIDLRVKHCIIGKDVLLGGLNSVLENNIFLNSGLISFSKSTIRNNVFLGSVSGVGLSSFYNNIFVDDTLIVGNDSYQSNNYIGIEQSSIFESQSGNIFEFIHNYHLKNPELYIGTDGTQVGLYGGPIPFKGGGLPSNPQIISKSVARETDASGNLNINYTVKAQEN